jgi:hypothetical protein
VVVDGRVAGTWRSCRAPGGRARASAAGPEAPARLAVVVEPFQRLDDPVLAGLEAEAVAVGRFLGAQATLQLQNHGEKR